MTDELDPQAWMAEERREAVGTPAEEALLAGVDAVDAVRVGADEHEAVLTIFQGCLDSTYATICPDRFLGVTLSNLELASVAEKERLADLVRSAWRAWDQARPFTIVSEGIDFAFRDATLNRLAAFYHRFRQTPYFVSDDGQRRRQANEEAFHSVLDDVLRGLDLDESEALYAYEAARKIAYCLGDERPIVELPKKSSARVNWAKEGF